jgi:hypothetical protein
MFNLDLDQNIGLEMMYLPQNRHIIVIFNLDSEFFTLQGAGT